MKFRLQIVLLLLPFWGFSQGGITFFTGKVLDKDSLSPIATAYISIPSTGFNAACNTNGEFKFSFPKINLDSEVVVSAVGYKNFKQKARAFDSTNVISLQAEQQAISAAGMDAKELVKTALDLVKKNYPIFPIYQHGFYLETIDLEQVGFVKINEAAIRIERFPNQKDSPDKTKLLKARKYEWKGQTSKLDNWGFENGAAVVTRSLETSTPDYLDKGGLNDYNFVYDSVSTVFDDKPVTVIAFSPVNSRVRAARIGKIYIDQETNAIIKIAYEMTPEGVKDIMKSSALSNTKKDGKAIKAYTQYRSFNGVWYLIDSYLSFSADFEGKLDTKYKNTANMNLRYVANESLKLVRPSINEVQQLMSTNNFPNGGIAYETRVWGASSCLIPTEEMQKIIENIRGKR